MGLCCCRTASVKTEEAASLLPASSEEKGANYVSIFDEHNLDIPLATKTTTANDDHGVGNEEDTKLDPSSSPPAVDIDALNRHIYEGFIGKFNGTNLTKYYAILHGTTLNIYIRKPIDNAITRKRNIYDMINISQFYDIDTYKLDEDQEDDDDDDIHYIFGVTFADRSGEFDAEYFMFETESQQKQWHDAFKSVMTIATESDEKKAIANDIECEWMSYECNLYWMVLPIHSTELWLYKDNRSETNRTCMRINLSNYNTVSVTDNTDDTLFKYGFMLTSILQPPLMFYSKSKHNRSKWVTHCDYVVTNKTNPIPSISDPAADADVSTVFSKQVSIDNDGPLQRLLSILECYNKWIESKPSFTFMWLLQTHLKSNYVSILNDYHQLLLEDKGIAIETECKDSDQCGCVDRHKRFKYRKSLYFGYTDHPNCVLFELLDRVHCHLYHPSSIGVYSRAMMNADCNPFGQDFTYYDEFKDAPHFVNAKYADLKDELLHNPYHALDSHDYYDFYLKALYLSRSEYVKRHCVVRDYGMICEIQGIAEEDVLSINHLLCLLLYSKHNALRKMFAQHCRKNSENETNVQLNERHSFIANWRRYLFETCFIFGHTLDANEFVFCAMNQKQFQLDSFDMIHFVPFSMTTGVSPLGDDGAMMLKLEKADDRLCRYFDMKCVSDTASERLFCGVRLKINDVMMANKSYSAEIVALKLLEMILKGNLFYFEWNQHFYAQESQLILVQFLEYSVNKKEDGKCSYFERVFDEILSRYMDDGFMAICLSFQQIAQLNPDLMEYFMDMDKDDLKGKLFAQNDEISVRFLEQPHVIKVTQAELALIRNDEYLQNIRFDEFEVANGDNETFTFDFEIEKRLNEDEEERGVLFNCNLYLKSCPPHIIKAKLFWDFVCVELQFENIEKPVELQRNACDTICNVPLFVESRLSALTFMINIKLLC
eukprot:18557_1